MNRREIRALRQEHIKIHIFKAQARLAMKAFKFMRCSIEDYPYGGTDIMGVGIQCAFPPYGTEEQRGANCCVWTSHADIISGDATIRTALSKMFADVAKAKVQYRFKCPHCGAVYVSIWVSQDCCVREDWDGEDIANGEVVEYGEYGRIYRIECCECGAETEDQGMILEMWETGDY